MEYDAEMRRAAKRDENEPPIIAALEAAGCSVDQLPGGNGRPDLCVGIPGCKDNALLEIKMPGERLNSLQKAWHAGWVGRAHVVTSVEQAFDVVKFYRERAR